MTGIPTEELFEFPCDHLFKVFGPNDEEFADALRSAVSDVTPVTLDAMKFKPSSGGNHQCISILLRVHDYCQLLAIYSAIQQLPRLRFLL